MKGGLVPVVVMPRMLVVAVRRALRLLPPMPIPVGYTRHGHP